MTIQQIVALVLLLGSALAGATAHAGTPDQDPIVQKLYNQLAQSRPPSLKDLQLGKTWVCKEYMAIHNDFRSQGPSATFKFSEFAGTLQNDLNVLHVNDFSRTAQGLMGRFTHPKTGEIIQTLIRITPQGDLLFIQYDPEYSDELDVESRVLLISIGICPSSAVRP
jgi:hypothetical protein